MGPAATLSQLLEGVSGAICNDDGRQILDIVTDTRQVRPGAAFVALHGVHRDGHDFLEAAIAKGAVAVVVSRTVEVPPSVLVARVPDTLAALPVIANRFFGDPSGRMTLVGITGTNGKTTSSYLIEAVLDAAGLAPTVIGTVDYRFGGQSQPAPNTTPDLLTSLRLLANNAAQGSRSLATEVSSHALDQRRVDGLKFDVGVFTNLTRDHLDYHGDLETYFQAKARLFTEVLPQSGKRTTAILNGDDEAGQRLVGMSRTDRTWSFSRQGRADATLRVRSASLTLNGIRAEVETPSGLVVLESPLVGGHNLENLLAALGVGLALELSPQRVLAALKAVQIVPGRLEEVHHPGDFKVLVDYAHTDDALRSVLRTLRPLCNGQMITVFGCGGGRDRGKRPLMGAAAAAFSDRIFVTTDNARDEDPAAIAEDVRPGLAGIPEVRIGQEPPTAGAWFQVELDREKAISSAIRLAAAGDVVLIAGKGHEDYQIMGSEKRHFDDREVARQALALKRAS